MATIEIDGKTLEAENGQMIIEVADEANIHIPRFCYHKKLSVAANCRMCLVEVENGRKPVPACATPITNGMKVYTQSEEAVRSQKAVMEFLLINHPLDCPICDQGGECELQDVSMGFGAAQSDYEEAKRSVDDENLGTLVSTEMTRCIHCTRCVRFGDEVAGLRELGATGRGENVEIGTYVEKSLKSEVSGNIIDLCPVGALTSKPYRYTARAWEMTQHDGIAPHDCLGSNIHLHTRRDELMRVVPKENETINETWLSDRDRFSYLGLKSPDRAGKPLIKKNGQWTEVDWETALKFTVEGLNKIIEQNGPEQVAAFSSPSSSLEEQYLLQKVMREIGVNNLDHRIHQEDFRDQDLLPVMPQNSLPYEQIEQQQHILLIGCNIHREVPLAGVRVRKAYRDGATINSISPIDHEYHFDVSHKMLISPLEMPNHLASIAVALAEDVKTLPEQVQKLLIGIEPQETAKHIAKNLQSQSAIILGAISENHPEASLIRTLVDLICELSDSKVIRLTEGSNSAGSSLAGMLPHRGVAGKIIDPVGLDIQQALSAKLKAYVLMGCDATFDISNPALAHQSMLGAEFVVCISAFASKSVQEYADVILPMAPYSETSGTYINIDGTWQTFKGAVKPYEEARPAWKILRVLGNLFAKPGFDYVSSEEVLQDIRSQFDMLQDKKYTRYYPESMPEHQIRGMIRVGEWPLYRTDAVVRHAQALQQCASADTTCIKVHPDTADRLKLGEVATVSQGDIEITLPLKRDERIAPEVVWVANAMPETIDLGSAFAVINIKR